MATVIADRVRETTTTSGTGNIALAGAVAGYRSFSSVLSNGDSTYYACIGATGEWEVGVGTFTASTLMLSRDTVLSSSAAGAKVNFGIGTKYVIITQPANYTVPAPKLAAIGGSALVGADDGSAGSLWTTVQGAFNYLRSSAGSLFIGFIQPLSGAIATTLQAKGRETAHVNTDFGATGLGVANDSAAIAAAFTALQTAGGGILEFDGVYNLGDDTATGAVSKFNVYDNITIVLSAKTKFLVKNNAATTEVFALRGSNIRIIGQVRVESDPTTPYTTFGTYGAVAVSLHNVAAGDCGNIRVDGIKLLRGSLALRTQNSYSSANRIVGIRVGRVETKDTSYGINFQNNGDDFEFDWLETDNAYRSYFVYGCKNHKGKGRAKNQYSTGTPINVTRYSATEGGSATNTENIDVEMEVLDGAPSALATLRLVGDGGASTFVKNVNLKLKANFAPVTTLSLLNFDVSGGAASATPFAAKIQDVFVEADTPLPTDAITYSPCSWTTPPNVVWRGSSGMTLSKAYSLTAIALTMEMLGARFLQNGGTLANNQALSGLDATNTQLPLAKVDASGNSLYGGPSTATGYSVVYGSAGGIYLNANATTVAQVYSGGIRPNTDSAYVLGTVSQRWSSGYVRTMNSDTVVLTATTVAGLPAAGTAGQGARKFVTDATATTFASIVAGGGANKVPVWSDGTNWLIG